MQVFGLDKYCLNSVFRLMKLDTVIQRKFFFLQNTHSQFWHDNIHNSLSPQEKPESRSCSDTCKESKWASESQWEGPLGQMVNSKTGKKIQIKALQIVFTPFETLCSVCGFYPFKKKFCNYVIKQCLSKLNFKNQIQKTNFTHHPIILLKHYCPAKYS